MLRARSTSERWLLVAAVRAGHDNMQVGIVVSNDSDVTAEGHLVSCPKEWLP